MSAKRCTGRCGAVKPVTAFGRSDRLPGGRRARCQECENADNRDRRAANTAAVFAHYGTVCACPGCEATDDLSIDHLDGGGDAHRRSIGRASGGADFHAWLIAQGFPEGYQTMCRPCNNSKGEGPACRLWHGDPGMRRCTGPCGLVLASGQFNRGDTRCRDCKNAGQRARYAARTRAVR